MARYTEVEHEPSMNDYFAMDAQDDGAEAYASGIPLADNPHRIGTRAHVAWSDGWQTERVNT